MDNFLAVATGPGALALRRDRGSSELYDSTATEPDRLTDDEIAHVERAQNFYMATVNEDGWPYVQHRGGEVGFVHRLGPTTIGWAERHGNRQYLGAGNVTADGRVSLIFVDYPLRSRLKLLGRATLHRAPSADLLEAVGADGVRHDGVMTVDVVATDWNCPKYIEPRFTRDQIADAVAPLHRRIDELEAQLAIR